MGDFAGFDLDRNTARAWSRFQARLADHIAEMTAEDTLVVETEAVGEDVDGAAPYVRFAGFGEGTMVEGTMVRGEVSGNAYLAEQHALGREQSERLRSLGWRVPTTLGPEDGEAGGSANFFVDLPVSEADRLAVMSVKALREVFGVPHPAFLTAGDLADPEDPASCMPTPVEIEEPLAIFPESDEQLRDFVDLALTSLFGDTPEKDDDGDIPVPWGSSLVFVRVDPDAPIVQLFSIVVEGVTDLRRAAFEVNLLNRDLCFLKFVLVEDRVIAQMHLPASPFVPEHLRSMLTGMSRWVDELDEDLVARIGGRLAFDPADEPDDETPPVSRETTSQVSGDTALLTILQLDADATETVDPPLAASICGYDQELILRLLRHTGEQETAWRSSRDQALLDGDTDEAGACAHELAAWEQTTSVLRRALRLVVERALGRDTPRASTYSGPAVPAAPATPRSRRRFPPRPRRLRYVSDAKDLLRAYDVEDLVALDLTLSEISSASVEVFDTEDGIEVVVEDRSGELTYPFTLADLDQLLEDLGTGSVSDAEELQE